MRSSPNSRGERLAGRVTTAIFAAIAVAYPVIVYLLHDRIPVIAIALGASVLLLLRAYLNPDGMLRLMRAPLIYGALSLALLSVVDAALAAKAYPALISFFVAALFGNSLRHPPSLVERMARLQDPNLSSGGQEYCRRVTWLWAVWLVINGVIASILALPDNLDLWVLWTGLVSYICSGVLFVGEILLRPWILRVPRQQGDDA